MARKKKDLEKFGRDTYLKMHSPSIKMPSNLTLIEFDRQLEIYLPELEENLMKQSRITQV